MSNKLKSLQTSFMDTLLTNSEAIVPYIVKQGNISNQHRANIYTNAYRVRLREVIETDHDVLAHYLGDDLFDLLVEQYIQTNPSNSRSLRHFCDRMPKFLKEQTPFSEHHALSELAEFERLLLMAFDAAESIAIEFDNLLALEHEQWPTLKLQFSPSLQLFKSRYNSVKIWQALKEEKTPPSAIGISNQYWLVWRNKNRVTEFKSIQLEEFEFIRSLLLGNDFSRTCEGLSEFLATDDIGPSAINFLNNLFSQQLVVGFNT